MVDPAAEPASFNILSLCSGVGGLDLGLKLAIPSARTVCYCEIEAYAVSVLVSRMEEGHLDPAPCWSDLADFDGEPWRDAVDLVTGGYPCSPFSKTGKRQGSKDPRHLWPHFKRIISEVQPGFVFLENVPNHLNIGFKTVLTDLVELGYRVDTPSGEPSFGLFSAEEVGAPHERERLFCLAYRDSARLARRGLCDSERSDSGSSWSSNGALATSGVFPPRPKDERAWKEILCRDPKLIPALPVESGVRRIPNGTASRVDPLRAVGNVVVPAVAAKAWLVLWNRINEDDKEVADRR